MRKGSSGIRWHDSWILIAAFAAGACSSGFEGSTTTTPAPPTTSPVASSPAPPPSPTGAAGPTQLPAAEAWALVRRSVPTGAPVLRPTWLPAKLAAVDPIVNYAYSTSSEQAGYRYGVGYVTADQVIVFAAGGVNSGPPTSRETLMVRGLSAQFSTTDTWPALQLSWLQAGNLYSLQAKGITKDELLRVAAGLQPVP